MMIKASIKAINSWHTSLCKYQNIKGSVFPPRVEHLPFFEQNPANLAKNVTYQCFLCKYCMRTKQFLADNKTQQEKEKQCLNKQVSNCKTFLKQKMLSLQRYSKSRP